MFSCELSKIFKNTFFIDHLQVIASEGFEYFYIIFNSIYYFM